ncbi:MAG: glycosyltransferase [Zoogloeaceae bacterium]|jgi:rhamnosyltransferase|nr:glycosyltransferase [Zoogloeaceae bacterium]
MDTSFRKLACVTVTYQPDPMALKAQLQALPADSLKIVVDNASAAECVEMLVGLEMTVPNLHLLRNADNLGLGAALNQGVRAARKFDPEIEFVLLLDQDSEPLPGSIKALLFTFASMESSGRAVGAVGPLLRDAATGLTHGFHQCTRWRWKRVYPSNADQASIPCANLNGSGTLMRIKQFLELGGLREDFFIDHVDTEWSFRLLAHGLELWGVPQALFLHSMGQASIKYWLFCWRIWPSRAPARHYFLFRNAVRLILDRNVLTVWKFWAVLKLCLTAFVHALFDHARVEQLHNMARGVRDGFLGEQP